MTALIPDREAWLASTLIELAGTPGGEFDEKAYASAFAGRLAELLEPAGIVVLFCAGPGYPAVASVSSEHLASLARLEAGGTAGPAAECCRTGRAVRQVPLTAPATPWPEFTAAARAAGFGSVAALPMRHQDETVGAVTVLAAGDHPFDAAELSLAELLAEAAALGDLQQRALARSLQTTRQLQQALDSRVVIEQAKGALAARLDVTPGEAFQLLRGYSRRNGRPLSEVSGDVVRGALPARDLAGAGKAARRDTAGRQARALPPADLLHEEGRPRCAGRAAAAMTVAGSRGLNVRTNGPCQGVPRVLCWVAGRPMTGSAEGSAAMTSQVSRQPAAVPRGSPDPLEERLRRLEDRVATLTEAVRVLARGLEDIPSAEPGDARRAKAARRAHDLLLAGGQEREQPS